MCNKQNNIEKFAGRNPAQTGHEIHHVGRENRQNKGDGEKDKALLFANRVPMIPNIRKST